MPHFEGWQRNKNETLGLSSFQQGVELTYHYPYCFSFIFASMSRPSSPKIQAALPLSSCPSLLINGPLPFVAIYFLIMTIFSRYLPITSFIVGASALMFQTMVLYPWHNELDTEFKRLKELKEQQDKKLEEYNSKKMDKIHQLEAKLNYLIAVEEEKIRQHLK